MHIPDGYLSPETCFLMYATAFPIVTYATKQVANKIKNAPDRIALIGIGAACSFLIMMLNLPIPGGTSAHAVGATILAILLGPYEAVLALTLALILQAFIFGDGGVLALGANIINMAVIMPLFGYGIYSIIHKWGFPKIAVALGSYLGINLAALFVAIELGLQPILFHTTHGQPLYNPYPLPITITAMMGTHLFIVGIIEGAFAMIIYSYVLHHNPKIIIQQTVKIKPLVLGLIGLGVLTPLGTLISAPAWGNGPWTTSKVIFHRGCKPPKNIMPCSLITKLVQCRVLHQH
ncbi:cobalt transporter CbiM [Weissella coleopterorum]|uniref:Cobalt transporter CbiM n=1 Tax=Weissella coleopterorum TaxID=2714949 RepID=A0A6G8B1F0_9LACO|nr:cobalt transporter CbiM [Weissella coleopterorum]QIL51138.1 cobalt transporter CbiM [Weissella coleopterorum]